MMRLLLSGVLLLGIIMATVVMLTRAHTGETDGALVHVEVENENETLADVVVNLKHVDKSEESHVDPSAEPFIPKKEWQHVKPGQSIPSGLHVRLNLETGEREAKLMEGDDGSRYEKNIVDGTESSRLKELKKTFEKAMKGVADDPHSANGMKFWQHGGKEGILNTKKDSFTRAELKEALKKFKATSDDVKTKKQQPSGNFRNAEQLKQDLAEMNLEMKTDLEVMDKLMEQHRTHVSTDHRRAVLEELEWLVHQIDNAQYLVDSGGLQLVVQDLNHSDPIVSREAAYVIGSAAQSNPQVQVAVMKAGVLHQLIHKLSTTTEAPALNKLLYALSTLVRNFPYAQQKLVEGGGLQTLSTLLATSDETRVKVKILTLVTDIVIERKQVAEQYTQHPTDDLWEKLKQYKMVDFSKQLAEQDWCRKITPLLSLPEHDSREKVLHAMDTLLDMLEGCVDSCVASQPQLEQLEQEYLFKAKEEAEESDSDSYFSELYRKITIILRKIKEQHRHHKHTDL